MSVAYHGAGAIRRAVDVVQATADIAAGFAAYSRGEAQVPPVGYLGFTDPPGDCHIKFGHIRGQPEFVIKVATGFYDNPARGLPSSNGLIVVLSAETGAPLAILDDEGYLTDLRTAIAGLIVAQHCAPAHIDAIGIVGTGIQARLQAQLLRTRYPQVPVVLWGRSEAGVARVRAELAADGIAVEPVETLPALCARANLIVTTTPATRFLIAADWVRPGTHITAIGADAPGKQELDPQLWTRATLRVVDSRAQCIDHGEVAQAVHDGLIEADTLIELGAIISGTAKSRANDQAISIADLTGLAVQDIQIARHVRARLHNQSDPRPDNSAE